MFVVTDDGYGTIKVELNNLTVFNTSTITTSTYTTINNLTRAFHYYSGIDINGRYNQSIVVVTETVSGGQPPTGSGWVFHKTTDTMQIQPGWIMQDANGVRHTVTYSGENNLFGPGWGVGFANNITIAWPLTFYPSHALLKDYTTTQLFVGFNYNTRDKTATTATSIVKLPV
jgi:hypothetical protein